MGQIEDNGLTGKGEVARDRLHVIDSQIVEIKDWLKRVRACLDSLMTNDKGMGSKETFGNENSDKKILRVVGDLPERIWFRKGQLPFYVDFTITAAESESLVDVRGCIVFGSCRPFVEDRQTIIDKPLATFHINRDGLIRSGDSSDDQWRVFDETEKEYDSKNKKAVQDMHYRALDRIWTDALAWINEDILP